MTTALAGNVHDCDYATRPEARRVLLRDLARHTDQFTTADIRRAVHAWTPGIDPAIRDTVWLDLVIALAQLDSIRDGSLEPRQLFPNLAVGREYTESTQALAQTVNEHLSVLTGGGAAVSDEGCEQTSEESAVAAHQACHERWDRLSPEQRSGTTFHGWESHVPPLPRSKTDAVRSQP